MSKKDNEKKKIRENKKRSAFFDRKASCFSAIIVVTAMVNECFGFLLKESYNINYLYVVEIILFFYLCYMILCSTKFDKIIKTDKAEKVAGYLTTTSLIDFILGLVIKISTHPILIQILLIIITLEMIGGVVYFLFDDYHRVSIKK